MTDRDFILQVLGDFGREVSNTTIDYVAHGRISQEEYIRRSAEQLRSWTAVLLEWYHEPIGSGYDDRRDNT